MISPSRIALALAWTDMRRATVALLALVVLSSTSAFAETCVVSPTLPNANGPTRVGLCGRDRSIALTEDEIIGIVGLQSKEWLTMMASRMQPSSDLVAAGSVSSLEIDGKLAGRVPRGVQKLNYTVDGGPEIVVGVKSDGTWSSKIAKEFLDGKYHKLIAWYVDSSNRRVYLANANLAFPMGFVISDKSTEGGA